MGVASQSSFSVTLGDVKLTCIPDPNAVEKADGDAFKGTFFAQDSTRQFTRRDVPEFIRQFKRGAGFVEERDEEDKGGLAWAEDGFTHLGNGLMPSGRRLNVGTNYGLVPGGGVTVSAALDSVLFNGHLWALCTSGHIVRWPNADPTAVPVFDPALNAFGDANRSFRTGYRPEAIAVFATAAGVPAIYVSTYNTSTTDTRIYQYTVAGGWSEGNVLGYRASKMATCWWEGRDGVGAERLHILADANSIVRHAILGNDPLAGASYITPITVGNPAFPVTALVGAPTELLVVKKNGIHRFNELRSWNETPYWEGGSTVAFSNAALIYDDHLYAARGLELDRLDLRRNGAQQRIPGTCTPMAFMQDGTPIVGYITALGQHDGWLLASVYNTVNQKTYVGRAKDRRILNVDVQNPLVWYFAEQVIGNDTALLHIRAAPSAAAAFGIQPSSLWMFAGVGFAGMPTSDLFYAPLPNGSGPLSLQASGGSFSFNPTAKFFHTALIYGDRNANKGIRRLDIEGRKVSATRTIEIKSRAGGDPATIADTSTYTSQGTAIVDSTSITPSPVVTGHSIQLLSILTTPSPYTTAPILHEISPRARVVREVFDVRYLWVILERDHELDNGAPDPRNMDTVWGQIGALQNSASPSDYIDENGVTRKVYVEQGIEYGRSEIGDGQWRTVARLELSLLT